MDTYVTYLDQLRYILGTLSILFMLCHGILTPKPDYRFRAVLCSCAAILSSLLFIPLQRILLGHLYTAFPLYILYWSLLSMVPVMIIRICYETNWSGALFRAILCVTAESYVTGITYYLLVKCLFPDLPTRHKVLYSFLLLITYAFFLYLGYSLLRARIAKDEGSLYETYGKTKWSYLFTYISFYVLIDLDKLCFEWIIQPLTEAPKYAPIYTFLKYFLVLNMLLLSAVVSFIMISAYQSMTQQNEQQIVMQILKDRQAQYDFSRENIEMINRKAHDLKHQFLALEQISDEERRQKIQEATRSIDFYDAVVKTGNAALDTLLTEKNVYCLNRGIRLSCTVHSLLLNRIDVVDLYTLLGNALDNAIEAVEKLSNPDKKTISLTIRDQDQMIFIQLENYFDGSLHIKNGLPSTTKQDTLNHGFGSKSIRAIVQRNGGSVMIGAEDQIFSLDILIPT